MYLIYLTIIIFLFHINANAYIDPASGSLILQSVIAFVAAFIFYLKNPKILLKKIYNFLLNIKNKIIGDKKINK